MGWSRSTGVKMDWLDWLAIGVAITGLLLFAYTMIVLHPILF